MHGAFGKPYGKVARVGIGQVLLSMRCREDKTESAQEALRRACAKGGRGLPIVDELRTYL